MIDMAEELRCREHFQNAIEVIESCLLIDPHHFRALLVQSRILYREA